MKSIQAGPQTELLYAHKQVVLAKWPTSDQAATPAGICWSSYKGKFSVRFNIMGLLDQAQREEIDFTYL